MNHEKQPHDLDGIANRMGVMVAIAIEIDNVAAKIVERVYGSRPNVCVQDTPVSVADMSPAPAPTVMGMIDILHLSLNDLRAALERLERNVTILTDL